MRPLLNLVGARACGLGFMLLLVPAPLVRLEALSFYSSGLTTFNTSEPTGDLAGSGWQFQGQWGSYLGTPVSPTHFITAKHVGGTVGGTFSWRGTNYTTIAKLNHPTADLTLWRIEGTFPEYASLYEASNEVGKGVVVHGRSGVRGAPVTVLGASPSPLRGWQWSGTGAGTMRWGQNVVQGTVKYPSGDFIMCSFRRFGGVNEATLAGGDSGGAVFIKDGTTWKLAGINYGVDADFALTATGPSMKAAMFDAGGTYWGATAGRRTYIYDRTSDISPAWVATRISAYASWIRSSAGVP